MRGTEPSGSPFRFIDPNGKHYCMDEELKGDFEGAIERLRHTAMLFDVLGQSRGETDARKGNLKNVAMTLRGVASNAERGWAKVQASDLSSTGVPVKWQDVRDHGASIAYDLARRSSDEADEEYWT